MPGNVCAHEIQNLPLHKCLSGRRLHLVERIRPSLREQGHPVPNVLTQWSIYWTEERRQTRQCVQRALNLQSLTYVCASRECAKLQDKGRVFGDNLLTILCIVKWDMGHMVGCCVLKHFLIVGVCWCRTVGKSV